MKALGQIERLQLLAAFQVLSLPSGTLGVKHKRAREVIELLTGKPVKVSQIKGGVPTGLDLTGYLAWHGTPNDAPEGEGES